MPDFYNIDEKLVNEEDPDKNKESELHIGTYEFIL